MILTLERHINSDKATLGKIVDQEGNTICYTLENPWYGNMQDYSCIPEGEYTCERDTSGRFRYWKINDVPSRQNIEFHPGNWSKDTRGCILLGDKWIVMSDLLAVANSVKTCNALLDKLPETFTLRIVRV
jgi:hypothetical protein